MTNKGFKQKNSKFKKNSKRSSKKMERWVAKYIEDRKMKVLRSKFNGKALNVSFTEDGLKWTCNKVGRMLYYENAYFTNNGNVRGDLTPSSKVYVEDFVPREFNSRNLRKIELTWVEKAWNMSKIPPSEYYREKNSKRNERIKVKNKYYSTPYRGDRSRRTETKVSGS